jgi:hypothetical protein
VNDLGTVLLETALSGAVLAAVVAGLFKLLSDNISSSRAQSESIWKNIDSHIATEYWPLTLAAWGFSAYSYRWLSSKANSDVLACFHWYVQFAAIQARMSQSHVWILLTHTDAEGYVQDLGTMALGRPGLTGVELSTLSQQAKLGAPLAETAQDVQQHSTLKPIYDRFQAWMTNSASARDVRRLSDEGELLASLMTSEFNRMYWSWYGRDWRLRNLRLRRQAKRYLKSTR